jgi:hypothetical protein
LISTVSNQLLVEHSYVGIGAEAVTSAVAKAVSELLPELKLPVEDWS